MALQCILHSSEQLFPDGYSVIRVNTLTIPKRQIIDSSKLKDFADDNFKYDENGRKFF